MTVAILLQSKYFYFWYFQCFCYQYFYSVLLLLFMLNTSSITEKKPCGSQHRRKNDSQKWKIEFYRFWSVMVWIFEVSFFIQTAGGSGDEFLPLKTAWLVEAVRAWSWLIPGTTNTASRADATHCSGFPSTLPLSLTPSYCHSTAAFED